MHTLQKLLITRLVKENGLNYSVLTKGYDAEDNIAFHLKQLTSKGLVEKRNDRYFLTAEGVNTLNSFQKTDLQDNAFKMTYVGYICLCGDSVLIKPHKNASEIFYNLPSGSPLFAEDLNDALTRIFYEETDINLPYESFSFDSLHMKTIKAKNGKVLFDDAFVVYKVEVSEDQKTKMKLKKGCEWKTLKEIENLDNKWPEIDQCVLRRDWEVYKKYTVVCDYILKN